MLETPLIFTCKEKQLVAIEHSPDKLNQKSTQGVLIVVGGPQTRVGSHRLFVQLARALAEQGYYALRFDYSGAGDSEGAISQFTDIQDDIAAALALFRQQQPQLTEIYLWGLCDAASAILLHLAENKQNTVSGLVLVNPWVRQASTQAKTYLKSYYVKRLLSKSFWGKLIRGNVKPTKALSDIRTFQQQSKTSPVAGSFVDNMYIGLRHFAGNVTVLLSECDLTAEEFKLLMVENTLWRTISKQENIKIHTIAQANHTFSEVKCKDRLITETLNAIKSLK
ncbi:hydrolase 1, exosortase A system-associated [Colwellia asteriadis]|uniref:Hydrolase 1, exosortase A system-associated n=1 Tax=Colwellia asteriadis TaxID=517723 RepID=A0ABN1LB99_9GAMM